MRFHLFPFRTEKLSSLTPMVLRFSRGRVGSRLFKVRSYDLTFFLCPARSGYRLDGRWGNALSRRGLSRSCPSETGFGGRSKAGSRSRAPTNVGGLYSLRRGYPANPYVPQSPACEGVVAGGARSAGLMPTLSPMLCSEVGDLPSVCVEISHKVFLKMLFRILSGSKWAKRKRRRAKDL